MRYISLLVWFLWCPLVWAAPDTTMSITPTAVAGTVITAADVNARSNAAVNAYNVHSHTDLTKTTQNSWTVGDGGTINNKSWLIANGTTTTPVIRYNVTKARFQYANDGTTFVDMGDYSARAFNSGAISLTSGTATVLTMDSERFDTDNIHSTSSNTSRLTATTAGKYLISGSVEFAASGSGQRRLEIFYNGATVIAGKDCNDRPFDPALTVECAVSTYYNLAANDYVELRATQRVSSTLNINSSGNYSPEFEMVKTP